VVVVSSLGGAGASGGGAMGWPNGELDPWADWIVGQRFRYVQISGFYDQQGDITTATAANLPDNAFGTWMAGKVSRLFPIPMSSDQIAILALALPSFVTTIGRAAVDGSATFDSATGPPLVPQQDGHLWIAPTCDGTLAADRLWEMLSDARTFRH